MTKWVGKPIKALPTCLGLVRFKCRNVQVKRRVVELNEDGEDVHFRTYKVKPKKH